MNLQPPMSWGRLLLVGIALSACSHADDPVTDDDSAATLGDGGTQFSFADGATKTEGSGGTCASTKIDAKRLPVYVAFVFDKSLSMASGNKFAACAAGMKRFFADPRSIGMSASLQFFPLSTLDCREELYATPRVSMRTLPDAQAFAAAIDAEGPNTLGTPALPALKAAYGYLKSARQGAPAGTRALAVLVTDGVPISCGSTVDSVSRAAAEVANDIPTFVVGLGNERGLDAIAAAGKTGKPFVVPADDPTKVTERFTEAMEQLKKTTLGCDYAVPDTPAGKKLDVATVNVVLSKGSSTETLAYDKECVGGGWRYDNPDAPTRILLCPKACADLTASATSVELQVGCTTKGATNGQIPR